MRSIGVYAIGLLALITAAACAPIGAAGQTNAITEFAPQRSFTAAQRSVDLATPALPSPNVAVSGSAHASAGGESSHLAIDGSEETFWSALGGASQWVLVALDDFYLADRIELVVTQAPAGPSYA